MSMALLVQEDQFRWKTVSADSQPKAVFLFRLANFSECAGNISALDDVRYQGTLQAAGTALRWISGSKTLLAL
jgi:hypothetical protein